MKSGRSRSPTSSDLLRLVFRGTRLRMRRATPPGWGLRMNPQSWKASHRGGGDGRGQQGNRAGHFPALSLRQAERSAWWSSSGRVVTTNADSSGYMRLPGERLLLARLVRHALDRGNVLEVR